MENFIKQSNTELPFNFHYRDFAIKDNVIYYNQDKDLVKLKRIESIYYSEKKFSSWYEENFTILDRPRESFYHHICNNQEHIEIINNRAMYFKQNESLAYYYFWFLFDISCIKKGNLKKIINLLIENQDFFVMKNAGAIYLIDIVKNQNEINAIKTYRLNQYYKAFREHDFSTTLNHIKYSVSITKFFESLDLALAKNDLIYLGLIESLMFNGNEDVFISYIEKEFSKIAIGLDTELQSKIIVKVDAEDVDVDQYRLWIDTKVVHLNTSHKLRQEGCRMRHCVGGYTYRVKYSYSLIFSLIYKNDKSTLEFQKKDGMIEIKQHKSIMNGEPIPELKTIAEIINIDLIKKDMSGNLKIRNSSNMDNILIDFELFLDE